MNIDVQFTHRDLRSTPDDHHRYELFEGDLVMTPLPSCAHQDVILNLNNILPNHIQAQQWGRLVLAPFGVYFDEETVVQPDIRFVSIERLHAIDE
jgi:hypothetical protein